MCAVIAAVVAFVGVWLGVQRTAKTATRQLTQDRLLGDIDRCWERFTWIVANQTKIAVALVPGMLDALVTQAARLGDRAMIDLIKNYIQSILAIERAMPPSPPADDNTRAQAHTGQEGEKGHT